MTDNPFEDLRGAEPRDIGSLQYVSKIKEMVEISEFLEDPAFDDMMNKAVRCLIEPNMRQETAKDLLIQFQAASTKFGVLAVYYTTLRKGRAGTEDNMKKNLYYTLSDVCDKMAQSLKYVARRDTL